METKQICLILALLGTFSEACMSYGQPVADTQRGILFVNYTKNFLGLTTSSGVLTCVPSRTSLECINAMEIVDSLSCSVGTDGHMFYCVPNVKEKSVSTAEAPMASSAEGIRSDPPQVNSSRPAVQPPDDRPPIQLQPQAPPSPSSTQTAAPVNVVPTKPKYNLTLGSSMAVFNAVRRLQGKVGQLIEVHFLDGRVVTGPVVSTGGGEVVVMIDSAQLRIDLLTAEGINYGSMSSKDNR